MPKPILAIGGASLDRVYLCTHAPALGTSNPVTRRQGLGGVARNVAESLARLGARARLISAIGEDDAGRAIAANLEANGLEASGLVTIPDRPTAEYTAALWQGELFAGFADMAILDLLTPDLVAQCLPNDIGEWLVFADCNLPRATLAMLSERARGEGFGLACDGVSLAKSSRLPDNLADIAVLFLNAAQAGHLGGADAILARGVQTLVLTQGRDGVTICEGASRAHVPAPAVPIVSVSGAGDALVAGTLLGLSEGRRLPDSVAMGLAAAALALQTMATVPPHLTRAALEAMCGEIATSRGTADAR